MRTVAILIACTLLLGAVAAPSVAAASPGPTCVTHPCGPQPGDRLDYVKEVVECTLGKITGRGC